MLSHLRCDTCRSRHLLDPHPFRQLHLGHRSESFSDIEDTMTLSDSFGSREMLGNSNVSSATYLHSLIPGLDYLFTFY